MNSFRLVALYTGNFAAPLKNQMLNFCADYHASVEEDTTSKLRIIVKHRQILPDDFFTLGENSKNGCVKSVSAIIGENGIGKTTIARLLCNLLNKDDWNGVLLYEQQNVHLAGYMKRGTHARLKLFIDENGVEKEMEIVDHDYEPFPFHVFYYSPHFTTEQLDTHTVGYHGYRQLEEEGHYFYDISTTRLMQHPEPHSELLLKDGISQTAIYDADEKIRIFEFISAWNKKIVEGKLRDDDFQIPKPQGVSIGINVSLMRFAIGEWNRKIEKCRKDESGVQKTIHSAKKVSVEQLQDPVGEYYRTLIGAFKNATDNAAKIGFAASVFMGYAAEYILDCGIEHVPLSRNLNDDPYGIFLYALHDFILKWDWKDKWPQNEEVISFFTKHQPVWPHRSQDSLQNSAQRFFALIQELIVSCKNEKGKGIPLASLDDGSNVVNCRLGDDNVFKKVCELVHLHRLTQVISPYLIFDVLPHMSSGEMSFLSLFARLYYFIRKQEGDENVVVFLDEAETTLHPEWQRRLISYCIRFFEIFLPGHRYQLIFASHSPMLLADLPKGNVVLLKKGSDDDENKSGTKKENVSSVTEKDGDSNKEKEPKSISVGNDAKKQTFAAHIFDLYKDSFFLDQGTMGEFAASKVDALLKKINLPMPDISKMTNEQMMKAAEEYQRKLREIAINPDDLKVARLIGDPFLSRYVWRRLEELNKDYDTPEDEQGGEGNGDRS